MKTLPKYYVIKRDENDPRWIRYVDWIKQKGGMTFGEHFNFWWFDGYNESQNWYECWDIFGRFANNPTLITLDDWEEATQGKQKPKPKRHTYSTTYTREDWVSFTADSIDGKKISDLEAEEKEHYAKARVIRALLNAHRNLKF